MSDIHQQYGRVETVYNNNFNFASEKSDRFMYLRHLVDRRDERRELRKNLVPNKSGRIFAAVVPGLADDSLEGFLELCHVRVLKQIATRNSCGIDSIHRRAVHWPDAQNESADTKLERLLEDTADVLSAYDHTVETLRESLVSLQRHVLLSIHISHDLWENGDEEILEQYFSFWQSVAPVRENQLVFLLVTAMLDDPKPASSPPSPEESLRDVITRGLDKLKARFEPRENEPPDCVCFDPLGRVDKGDISRWARTEVQNEVTQANPEGASLDIPALIRGAEEIAGKTPDKGWVMIKLEDALGECLKSSTHS